ncbi:hypothetical protein JTE90_012617 [Oedothorax gibbosus]|uniref:Uncharacterized protein n=1 Tax=Oedothorax gibbosus TaxID=931172 RepID=A0AAV6TIW6_9ARAC|nr:hypothetical protein JTE90_012617 [Oedothorax gibbosus]
MNETAPKKAADDDSEEVQRKNEENFDYTPPQDSLMQDPRILLQMNCVPLIRISRTKDYHTYIPSLVLCTLSLLQKFMTVNVLLT